MLPKIHISPITPQERFKDLRLAFQCAVNAVLIPRMNYIDFSYDERYRWIKGILSPGGHTVGSFYLLSVNKYVPVNAEGFLFFVGSLSVRDNLFEILEPCITIESQRRELGGNC